jgi:hypothetical protein
MNVSDDVTLLWSDDNRGNIRRIPIGNEGARKGGSGMYYHFDYVGSPRNYKWINTIQLQKTWEQMTLAYDSGVHNIWIANVGDLKGLVSLPGHSCLTKANSTASRNCRRLISWQWLGTDQVLPTWRAPGDGSKTGVHVNSANQWPRQQLPL